MSGMQVLCQTQFGNNVNQKITLSRKESSPFTNTLVCVNKVWTLKPESPMGHLS